MSVDIRAPLLHDTAEPREGRSWVINLPSWDSLKDDGTSWARMLKR